VNASRWEDNDKQGDEDSFFLPPRKQIHPTEKGKWTVLFYRLLLAAIILLAIGLGVWGVFYT